MVGKTKPITKADRARFEKLHQLGCICCRIKIQVQKFPCTIHHLLGAGRRLGHQATIPACRWHHLGTTYEGLTKAEMTLYYGPSLANGSKPFKLEFGTDNELLALVNDLIVS